jgi:glycosyltransferase involved in cell wall biosynthesis
MRVLLIAYEFPPSASPQSLRWAYLCRELAAQGHQVHVLTIDLGGAAEGLPALPDSVVVHRTFAGPVRGMLAGLRDMRGRARNTAAASAGTASSITTTRHARSWKQTLSEQVQGAASKLVFPDVRGEWYRWGKAALQRLLVEVQPDVVVSSHEPATTLELGLLAKEMGFAWVADLGDPVLALYTPARWSRRALRLEHATCAHADHVIVTNQAARMLMETRHQRRGRITVLTQGYNAAAERGRTATLPDFATDRLELLYTGSFYRFRTPDAILSALQAFPMARLNIAAVTVPASVLAAAARMPDQVRLLGFMPHLDAVQLQRRAHVLVNIANEDPSQVPGKLYEYLGAGRPVLHLYNQPGDAISELLTTLDRGWSCRNQHDDIQAWLETHGRAIAIGDELPSHDAAIDAYSWQSIARQLHDLLVSVVTAKP